MAAGVVVAIVNCVALLRVVVVLLDDGGWWSTVMPVMATLVVSHAFLIQSVDCFSPVLTPRRILSL